MRIASIVLIFVACGLITLGRHEVRASRRGGRGGGRRRALGWSLTVLGTAAMIAGVVLW